MLTRTFDIAGEETEVRVSLAELNVNRDGFLDLRDAHLKGAILIRRQGAELEGKFQKYLQGEYKPGVFLKVERVILHKPGIQEAVHTFLDDLRGGTDPKTAIQAFLADLQGVDPKEAVQTYLAAQAEALRTDPVRTFLADLKEGKNPEKAAQTYLAVSMSPADLPERLRTYLADLQGAELQETLQKDLARLPEADQTSLQNLKGTELQEALLSYREDQRKDYWQNTLRASLTYLQGVALPEKDLQEVLQTFQKDLRAGVGVFQARQTLLADLREVDWQRQKTDLQEALQILNIVPQEGVDPKKALLAALEGEQEEVLL